MLNILEKDVQEINIKFYEDYVKQIESKDSLKNKQAVLSIQALILEKIDKNEELLKTVTDNYLKNRFNSIDDQDKKL